MGKSPADLEADAATMAQYRQLQAMFKLGKAVGERLGAAVTATIDFQKETQRINAERAEQLHALLGAENDLRGRQSAAESAAKQMNDLKLKHAELFMHEKDARPEDLI